MLAVHIEELPDSLSKHPAHQVSSSQKKVALLGIAQRSIRVQYAQKSRKEWRAKPLPVSIKTIGDWIQVNRIAKNFRPGHLALKMGIATDLVQSWEDGSTKPNEQQLKILTGIFGAKIHEAFA